MNTLKNILLKLKQVTIWTIIYTIIVWCISYFIFDFNILSDLAWEKLLQSRIHGFNGFVFGIFILSIIPLYLSSSIIIFRTQKQIFPIQVPAFIQKFFSQFKSTPTSEPAPQTSTPEPNDTKQEKTPEPPQKQIPKEMQNIFERIKISTYNKKIVLKKPIISDTPTEPEMDDFPIPSDFDIDTQDFNAGLPKFKDVNFDINSNEETTETNTSIINTIKQKYESAKIENDIITTDKLAIAIHQDPEFWIADDEAWFAAGEQKESPINKLLDISNKQNLTPIFLFLTNNILDFEEKRKTWESMGIKIITDVSDL